MLKSFIYFASVLNAQLIASTGVPCGNVGKYRGGD